MDVDDLDDVTLVAGAPRSGKTRFALDMLVAAMKRHGDAYAVMTVSGRQVADRLGDTVIRELSAISQARPVTTLPAVAFRIMTAVRSHAGQPLPKLRNGAEQDVVIRRVLARHAEHAEHGDECSTCALLRTYFVIADWSGMVVDDATDAFANQLRDMLARMNEIGAKPELEDALISRAADEHGTLDERRERLRVQWRLAFALRAEYNQAINEAYPDQYRLDASQLMIDAAAAVNEAKTSDLPKLVIVDDFQDATLAGFDFLTALRNRGVRLLLVGNPDETVQTFRGSYPEYLFNMAQSRLGARLVRLEPSHMAEGTDLAAVASRVSLTIASTESTDDALANRPGKMPAIAMPETHDGSLEAAMYRSTVEELDDVVWKIKTEHLEHGRDWNDMAVIAHDNATVRTFGERLRADGVPVRYSSVTRPLKDEPFVQGLFAMIELAELKRRGIAASSMDMHEAGTYIRSRVRLIMDSPLITTTGERPARLSVVESAMNALGSLAAVLDGGSDASNGSSATDAIASVTSDKALLPRLLSDWNDYVTDFHAARESARDTESRESAVSSVVTDDSLLADNGKSGDADDPSFGVDALYILLLEGNTARVLDAIASVLGKKDPQSVAFSHLWKVLDDTMASQARLTSREPQYMLDCAWRAFGKATTWQKTALRNNAEGRAANDRLDTAMRLFSYASGGESNGVTAAHTIDAFIEQVRALAIEADSLAHTAPIDQAVTLTTPAGAAGKHWKLVFMPALQQGQWPNLAPRNTLFGGEELADIMLHGRLSDDIVTSAGRENAQLAAVLASEQKSLLVALTRADERVTVSAVLNEDHVPSDFLYGYLPEWFDRDRDADAETRVYTAVGEAGEYAGLEADPRGLVAAARSVLAHAPTDSPQARDAAQALALLALHGIAAANPDNWAFLTEHAGADDLTGIDGKMESDGKTEHADKAKLIEQPESIEKTDGQSDVVTLSPSAVDSLWACPVCWMLENRFAGPRMGSAATSFGSLIHTVAQQATETGLDLPQNHTAVSDEDNIDEITQWMIGRYKTLRGDLNAIDDPEERYKALGKDAKASVALRNIATYFVKSNRTGYPSNNTETITVGTLDHAEAERQFAARFGFDDILDAYNAIDGNAPISRDELIAIMGALVGGWPETGMSDRLTVRLSGRIDRLEHRRTADGREQVRLIDYKTGKVPNGRSLFSDLQLVCYQLGLAFPEHGGKRGAQAIAAMPDITQSALFHVMEYAAPAPRKGQGDEAYHQQALFAGGSINAGDFIPRKYVPKMASVFTSGLDDVERPAQVSEEHWKQLLESRSKMTVWSLTMISRVFYAAAASRATRITARPTAEHVGYCRTYGSGVCPACQGEQNTVFERTVA